MRSINEPKSNGQRLFEAFKQIKKHQMGLMKPFTKLRPSEVMMLHSIFRNIRIRAESNNNSHENASDCLSGHMISNTDYFDVQGLTISELSEFTQMTASAVSQTVKALEEKGYIKRTVNPSDRRLVFINISENGFNVLHETEKSFMEYLDKITEAFGQENTSQLIELLEKLVNIIPQQDNNTISK